MINLITDAILSKYNTTPEFTRALHHSLYEQNKFSNFQAIKLHHSKNFTQNSLGGFTIHFISKSSSEFQARILLGKSPSSYNEKLI
uniref:Uncharacterized protein n=1 Tax=Cucumis melo TaxID=3656 RepID=A0A9I9ED37_CUCME